MLPYGSKEIPLVSCFFLSFHNITDHCLIGLISYSVSIIALIRHLD